MHITLMLKSALLAFLACAGSVAWAETRVSPAQPYEGQLVIVNGWPVAGNSCTQTTVIEAVEQVGNDVEVRYKVVPRSSGGGCFIPTPLGVGVSLGPFAPGSYRVTFSGQTDGTLLATFEAEFVVLPRDAPPPFARLELVEGDRQVAVGFGDLRLQRDVVVRATDARGLPVAGVSLVIVGRSSIDTVVNVDEFGYAGFGEWARTWSGSLQPDATSFATTDAEGIARARPPANRGLPASFVIGAGVWPNPGRAPQVLGNGVSLKLAPSHPPEVAVEYYNESLRRYVLIVEPAEIEALDRGTIQGWRRTAGGIPVWTQRTGYPDEAVPVCRFFAPQFAAHFLTADPAECDAVVARWPDIWLLETRDAFRVLPPSGTVMPETGVHGPGFCAAGAEPVYRLYRSEFGPAHRYVVGRAIRDAMKAAGWVQEGLGGDRGPMCVPQ